MVVPPRPQATASVSKHFFFMEMAVLLLGNFVGNRQHYAEAVDSRIFRLFIDFFGGPAKFFVSQGQIWLRNILCRSNHAV